MIMISQVNASLYFHNPIEVSLYFHNLVEDQVHNEVEDQVYTFSLYNRVED